MKRRIFGNADLPSDWMNELKKVNNSSKKTQDTPVATNYKKRIETLLNNSPTVFQDLAKDERKKYS
jgi:protein-disulfide isomerase